MPALIMFNDEVQILKSSWRLEESHAWKKKSILNTKIHIEYMWPNNDLVIHTTVTETKQYLWLQVTLPVF